jgi:hypothetical protein
MLEGFTAGDYERAIELADLILEEIPSSPIAVLCKEMCASALEAFYARAVGPRERVPVVNQAAYTGSVALDHRAGFLISLIDGMTTIEAILDVCAMPRWRALCVLADLIRGGIVKLR